MHIYSIHSVYVDYITVCLISSIIYYILTPLLYLKVFKFCCSPSVGKAIHNLPLQSWDEKSPETQAHMWNWLEVFLGAFMRECVSLIVTHRKQARHQTYAAAEKYKTYRKSIPSFPFPNADHRQFFMECMGVEVGLVCLCSSQQNSVLGCSEEIER